MSDTEVRKYLLPRINDFWRWEDAGEVAAWKDGSTIVFRSELVAILQRLSPAGLPPLDGILMLLAACRWQQDHRVLQCHTMIAAATGERSQILKDVLAGLDHLSDLPEELRNSTAAREEIVDLVFETSTVHGSPDLAARIVQQLRDGFPESWLGTWGPRAEFSYLPSLSALARGLQQVEAERIRLRLQTSLDGLPVNPEFSIPPVEALRALLHTHSGDEVIGGVVRLTKRVLAALSLPRPLADNDDLPMGGFSDITNRGPLDRLLISELAHDDLTLAVRVAVNEALFLRRETPPRARPRARSILIDQGIRTWGLPRVYATAVALALAASADVQGELSVLRTNKILEPADIATRSGLIELLEQLATDRHPGRALAQFYHQALSTEAGDHVLITTKDTMADQEFRPFLKDFAERSLYVVAVDREGGLDLLQNGHTGTRLLRTLQLSLDEVTQDKARPPAPEYQPNASLPAIMRQNSFPLRLPVSLVPVRCASIPDLGIVQVTRDGRVVLQDDSLRKDRFGSRQLADDLIGSNLLWIRPTTFGVSLVAGMPQQHKLTMLHYRTRDDSVERIALELPKKAIRGIWHHREVLFVIGNSHISAFSLATGQPMDEFAIPDGVQWHRQRFFRERNWLVLAHDGTRCVLEPLLTTRHTNIPPILDVFECTGYEGPLAMVLGRGIIYSLAQGGMLPLRRGDQPLAIVPNSSSKRVKLSSDGQRFVFPFRPVGESCRVAATANRLPNVELITDTQADETNFLEPGLVKPRAFPTLRVHLRRIGIRAESILLESRNGNWLEILLNHGADRLQLRPLDPKEAQPYDVRTFEEWPQGRKGLRQAIWQNGSRAILDSRGLLHLVGAAAGPVEFTLVLDEHFVSGWAQDDVFFGNPYYTGERPLISAKEALDRYLSPWVHQVSP